MLSCLEGAIIRVNYVLKKWFFLYLSFANTTHYITCYIQMYFFSKAAFKQKKINVVCFWKIGVFFEKVNVYRVFHWGKTRFLQVVFFNKF